MRYREEVYPTLNLFLPPTPQTMWSFFLPLLTTNYSKKKQTLVWTPVEIKVLHFGERSASACISKKAKRPQQERTKQTGLRQHTILKPLLRCPSFVFPHSAQENFAMVLRESQEVRREMPTTLHLQFLSMFFSLGHIVPRVTEALHPVCSLGGNPRLITFSSNIWHRREPMYIDRYLAQVTSFQSEDISNII